MALEGKQFSIEGHRFLFRGVVYDGPTLRGAGATLSVQARIRADLRAISEAGFTVVCTSAEAPDELLEALPDARLWVLDSVSWRSWPDLVGSSRRQRAALVREARGAVRAEAGRVAGAAQVVALKLAPKLPFGLVRHLGPRGVARILAELADAARHEDEALLLACGPLAGSATAASDEPLLLEAIDVLISSPLSEQPASLEEPMALSAHLSACHRLAPDRPVVVEIGAHHGAGLVGEARQKATLAWQFATALEQGVAGVCVRSWTDEAAVGPTAKPEPGFGLTRADGSPRPALDVARAWNARTVRDLREV